MTTYTYGGPSGANGKNGVSTGPVDGGNGGNGLPITFQVTGNADTPPDDQLVFNVFAGAGGNGGQGTSPGIYSGAGGSGGDGGNGAAALARITDAHFAMSSFRVAANGGNAGSGGWGSQYGGHAVSNGYVIDNGTPGDAGLSGSGTVKIAGSSFDGVHNVNVLATGGNGMSGGQGYPNSGGYSYGAASAGQGGNIAVTGSHFTGDGTPGNLYLQMDGRGGAGTSSGGTQPTAGGNSTITFSDNVVDISSIASASSGGSAYIAAYAIAGIGGNSGFTDGRPVGTDGQAFIVFTNNRVTLGAGTDRATLALYATGGGATGKAYISITGNVFDGGAGYDTLVIDGGTTVNQFQPSQIGPTFDMTKNVVRNFEVIELGQYGGTIIGDANANYLIGYISNGGIGATDKLYGGAGDDTLVGLKGYDLLYGGDGDDFLYGGADSDTLNGGLGNDWALYGDAGSAVSVSLQSSSAQNTGGSGYDTLIGIENLSGSNYADTLTGDGSANSLEGLNGDDVLAGSGGDDFLDGGLGNDRLSGGSGDDILQGGAGDDRIDGGDGFDAVSYQDAGSGVTVSLYGASAQNTGGGGTDTIFNVEDILGSAFADTLIGNNAGNYLTGLDGDDNLSGSLGDDALYGGAGNDRLSGGTDNDVLAGGPGADMLIGGSGADIFLFDVRESSANRDTIADFVSGTDRIELAVAAFAGLAGYGLGPLGEGELTFGTQATGAGQHLIYNSANGGLYYDADGPGGAGQILVAILSGHPTLAATDIVLV